MSPEKAYDDEKKRLEEDLEKIHEEVEEKRAKLDDDLEETEESFDEKFEEIEERLGELMESKDEMDDNETDVNNPQYQQILKEINDLEAKKHELKLKKTEKMESLKREKHQLKEQFHGLKEKMKQEFKEQVQKMKDETIERINFTLPASMKEDLQNLANNLGLSVSEVLRNSMQVFQNSLGQKADVVHNLESDLNYMGDKIERIVKESLNRGMFGKKGMEQPQSPTTPATESESHSTEKTFIPKKEAQVSTVIPRDSETVVKLKKRVRGLIKMHNNIPIGKLAQALNINESDAENIIYELVADEKIQGKLENSVFQYTNNPEEIIIILDQLIEKGL